MRLPACGRGVCSRAPLNAEGGGESVVQALAGGAAGQQRTMSCGAMAQPATAEFLGPMAVWAIRPLMELVGAGCAREAAARGGGRLGGQRAPGGLRSSMVGGYLRGVRLCAKATYLSTCRPSCHHGRAARHAHGGLLAKA